jgi:hypothetical protein
MTGLSTCATDKLLTEREASGLLNVKIYTLRKWRRDGCGPRYIRCGERLIRYIGNDIGAWLKENSFGSVADELRAKPE